MASESYYSHGFLIPLMSLYFVWQKKAKLKNIADNSCLSGIVIIASGLFVHVICAALRVYFISGFSFVFTLWGVILFFKGRETARELAFPVIFLVAMIPLPLVLIGNLTVKLKLFVAQGSTFLLNLMGFLAVKDGNIIKMKDSYLVVGAPCSGLRSLVSLLTLGIVFAYIVKMSRVKKAILFLSSIPVALISNVIRIALLAIVNEIYGEKVALGFFHDFSGFLMFGIAIAGLYGVNILLTQGKKLNA